MLLQTADTGNDVNSALLHFETEQYEHTDHAAPISAADSEMSGLLHFFCAECDSIGKRYL
jgi:hypothetical protein